MKPIKTSLFDLYMFTLVKEKMQNIDLISLRRFNITMINYGCCCCFCCDRNKQTRYRYHLRAPSSLSVVGMVWPFFET